jgi:cystathionine beta-lyase
MTETYNFDQIIPRRDSGSFKWNLYDEDILPMWVADTDFLAPRPVIEALRARVEHGIFGCQFNNPAVSELVVERLERLFDWRVSPSHLVFWPTLVAALNATAKIYGLPGHNVLMMPPIYPPFLGAAKNLSQPVQGAVLVYKQTGQRLHYEIDFDAFEASILPSTRLLMFCNPHNPIGRMYTREELERLADICLRHNLIVVSDEIHSDLILDEGRQHIPLATINQDMAMRTVTLLSPSKTFNLAGLQCGFAVVQDDLLREMMVKESSNGIVPHVNVMGWTAAEAAYRDGQPYLDQLLPYLRANRDTVVEFVENCLPGVNVTVPEATYLAWLDFRDTPIAADPFTALKDKGRVGLNDGKFFGESGAGFARLNFGCPRSVLLDGLERIRKTLESA